MEFEGSIIMKVLFISSGNSVNEVSSIIYNQGESLRKIGVSVDYLPIKGKGLIGYIKFIPKIHKHLRRNKYDIIHAHYSLSAFAASLSGANPLVVSLMGSDVKSKKIYQLCIKIFNWFFWSGIIVKSEDMKLSLGQNSAFVIPNGVDLEKYLPINKEEALTHTKWDKTKKHILFAANQNRPVKNFKLAQKAFELIDLPDVKLHSLNNVRNEHMPFYFNAADVVLLTSLWEGSPNVIKEAMACNTPVVSTAVGDVKYLLKEVKGCYTTSFNAEDIKQKILLALKFSETQGAIRIKQQKLDSNSIAKKIVTFYLKNKAL